MTLTPAAATGRRAGYRWAAGGDVNAFFGLMLDNIGDMILMASLLVGGLRDARATFVLTRMIPGTAVGVLVGDLIFTAMAFRLARRTGPVGRDGDAAGARHAEHLRRGLPDHRPGLPGGDRTRARPDGRGAARLVPRDRDDPGLGRLQARPARSSAGWSAGSSRGPGCSAR